MAKQHEHNYSQWRYSFAAILKKKTAEKLDTFAILVNRNLNFVKNILREYLFHIQYI